MNPAWLALMPASVHSGAEETAASGHIWEGHIQSRGSVYSVLAAEKAEAAEEKAAKKRGIESEEDERNASQPNTKQEKRKMMANLGETNTRWVFVSSRVADTNCLLIRLTFRGRFACIMVSNYTPTLIDEVSKQAKVSCISNAMAAN